MSNIAKAQRKIKITNRPLVLANMKLLGELARGISSEPWEGADCSGLRNENRQKELQRANYRPLFQET